MATLEVSERKSTASPIVIRREGNHAGPCQALYHLSSPSVLPPILCTCPNECPGPRIEIPANNCMY